MPSLDFNSLLEAESIDPKAVVVLRHRPYESELRKVFPWLIAERRELFDGYQKAHGPAVEQSIKRADYVASFFGHTAGKAIFVGLYRRNGFREISRDEYWRMSENRQLGEFGMRGLIKRDHCLWFDLQSLSNLSAWSGRLVCDWPGGERSWRRWADRNVLPVRSIAEESLLVAPIPRWQEIVLDWKELQALPSSWRSALKQWRGIYYIRDKASGKGYVGSAYGQDNLLGRWLGYAASGHGGNKLLRGLDPDNFEFSILQLLTHDSETEEVVAAENTWKLRLHTREPDGLNRN